LALTILLFLGWKVKNNPLKDGSLFLLFVALTAGAQLFVEGFRGDSTLLPGGIRVGQVLAWLVLAGTLWGMQRMAQTEETKQADAVSGL
jgi:prolipoprotein diacylglyceryltransferase